MERKKKEDKMSRGDYIIQ